MSQAASTPLRPIMRYPGGKARIAPWILSHMPSHQVYVEPFFGGGSVFFSKQRASVEVINDIDERVVNLYRVLRERPDELIRLVTLTPYALTEYQESTEHTADPLEDARRFLVRVWMAHGGKLGSISGWRRGWNGGNDGRRGSSATVWAGLPERLAQVVDRLAGVMIDHRPAVDVVAGWAIPDCVIYADPPYPLDTRNRSNRLYRYEMTDQEHIELIGVLKAHPGPVLLSGYRCELYDKLLTDWTRFDRDVVAYAQAERTESLWLNTVATNHRRQLRLEERL